MNKSSISSEAEERMLQKLKVECGHNTVNKLSQMFTDMTLSKELIAEFKKKQPMINGIEFQTEVLTSGHWPDQASVVCKLPLDLIQCS